MRIFAGAIMALFLCSCASVPGLYAELGAGYKFDNTSYVLRPECHTVDSDNTNHRNTASCGGDNPTAHFSAGYEINRRYRVEYHHFSHYFDGGSDRETHKDEVRFVVRWGGRDY